MGKGYIHNKNTNNKMKKLILILLCLIGIRSYSQMSNNPIPNLKIEAIMESNSHKHKISIANNVGMVFGGLVFMTAGYLGEKNHNKDNGFKGIANVVSPSRVAKILGGGCVIVGLTIRL